jgi:hypothetical protein
MTEIEPGLLGGYYTAISVVIVFQLLSLQEWLREVAAVETECELARHTPVGDLARERAALRSDFLRNRFPWLQITFIAIAVTGLSAIAILAALEIDLCWTYTVLPTVILLSVFAVATAATWIQGRGRLLRARRSIL